MKIDNDDWHYAVYTGDVKTMLKFVASNGDPDIRDAWGRNALHVAAKNKDIHTIMLLVNVFLLDVFAFDNDLRTPYHVALSQGDDECASFLAKKMFGEDAKRNMRDIYEEYSNDVFIDLVPMTRCQAPSDSVTR